MRLICALAIALALALVAPSVRGEEEPTARLEVYVFDHDRGLPLPGAEVQVGPARAMTDDAGFVALSVPPGGAQVVVGGYALPVVPTAAGQTSELRVTLRPGEGARVTGVEAPTEVLDAPPVELAGPPGSLTGQVVGADDGAPVADARVFVRGSDVSARTDAAGRFSMELPPGTWEISVVRVGFSTLSHAGITLAPAAQVEVALRLPPAAARLEDFVVSAPSVRGGTSALLQERQASGSVSDVLGAEQMSASGAGDAAAALTRVPGLTLVGGRYVYVRGLGERYAATLLNGASLPSPEPERRVVPLDLFPTRVLESVVIQKTFSPEMPAEFGGGVIRLRTKSVPEEAVATIGVSTGVTTGTSFRPGLTYATGPTDLLGVDGGWRALPDAVQAASDGEPLEESDRFSDRGYTAQELEAFGESMPNRWTPERRLVAPDTGISTTLGHGIARDGRSVGAFFGLGYGVGHEISAYDHTYTALGLEGELEPSHSYHFETGARSVRLGGILVVGASPHETQHVAVTTLLARKTDDEARIYAGPNRDVGADIRVSRLRFVERMLLTQQITGSHRIPVLGDLQIDWRYTWSIASRSEPDRREIRVDNEPGSDVWLLSNRPEGNQRVFSTLGDRGHDLGLDVTLPFAQWGGLPSKVQVGAGLLDKRRTVDTRRFKFMHKGPLAGDAGLLSKEAESIFVPEAIGPDGFQFEEVTRQTDNYSAGQRVGAVYALGELPLAPWVRLLAGVRVERSSQEVTTFELFNPDSKPVAATLVTTDVLPALTVTFAPRPSLLLRGGYGLTLSRPDFRELSPATFNDVTGGRETFGNPDLQRALIHNVDVRAEWYPSPGESLSVGAFYKRFLQPIEQVVVVSAQQSVSWANADAADNLGVELDGRKDFGFVHPRLADLFVAGNVSLIHSRVHLAEGSGIQTSSKRALQGQSPVVVNLSLGWDDPVRGTRISVLYNVFGRRIDEVGALGAPDGYEEPFHQLDLVASQELGPVEVGLSVKNLLNGWERRSQGALEVERRRRGVELGLSLRWDIARTARERAEARR